MNSRIYGVIGISSVMANWNADFSGYPKTTTGGDVFGSDKALKYPMKKMWEDSGEKILYIKSIKAEDGKYNPRTLKERYEYIFDEKLEKNKDTKDILKNLFKAVDVKNFGATFAESGANISITGVVQIGQGFNKYDETETQIQNILSPFQDSKASEKKGEEAKNTTLGTKIVSDECHYIYPFVINPNAYKEYVDMGVTEGYTEEDYAKFKNASISSATYFATNAKVGCENEFAMFVETDSELYLPNLDKYIKFEKGEQKNTIKIECDSLLNDLISKIKKIEIYYNPYTLDIETALENVEYYNIFTKQQIVK